MTEKATEKAAVTSGDCCSACSTAELVASDILKRPIDVREATAHAKINGPTRGQDLPKCRTRALPLHANLTGAVLNVTGDLVVDPQSCPVLISTGPGVAHVFPGGTNIGITVAIPPGGLMSGRCVADPEEDHSLCKWSFTRTSP